MTPEELQRLLDSLGPAWRVFLREPGADEPSQEWLVPRMLVLGYNDPPAEEPAFGPVVFFRLFPVFEEVHALSMSIPELGISDEQGTVFTGRQWPQKRDVIISSRTISDLHRKQLADALRNPYVMVRPA